MLHLSCVKETVLGKFKIPPFAGIFLAAVRPSRPYLGVVLSKPVSLSVAHQLSRNFEFDGRSSPSFFWMKDDYARLNESGRGLFT